MFEKGIIPRIGLDITSNKYNHFVNNFNSDASVAVYIMLITPFGMYVNEKNNALEKQK